MKGTLSLIILLVTSIYTVNSQDTSFIRGKIIGVDQRGGLPGVSIRSGQTGTASDKDGSFFLALPSGSHTITISFIGYRTLSENIDLRAADTLRFDRSLELATTELDMVVISASRTEQRLAEVTVSMEVLQSDFIRDKAAQNFQSALEQVPGVTITDEQASIRGGSGYSYGAGSRVLVLVDDLPLLTGDAGDVKWSFLPVELIDQVEVIKGASSSLYGSSALNGVVNLRTIKAGDKPAFRMSLYQGMYDVPKRKELKWWDGMNPSTVGASFAYSNKIGPMDLVLGGNMINDDGYRKGEIEQKHRGSILTNFRLDKNGRIQAGVNTSLQESKGALFLIWGGPDSLALVPAEGTQSNYNTKRTSIDPHFSWETAKFGTHKLRSRYFKTENINDTEQGSEAEVYFGEYQGSIKLIENLHATAGVSYTKNIVRSELYKDHESENKAAFLQLEYKWKGLTLSAGGRFEQYQVDSLPIDEQPVYRAGASYKLFSHTFLRASYGEGYRYPSIAERFIKTNVGNIYIYPNDSLVPESGWNAEIGIKQGIKIGEWRGYADVAVFRAEYTNMMEFVFGSYGSIFTDPFFGLGFKSVNTAATRISGVDVGLSGAGKIKNVELRSMLGYTYIKPVYLDFKAEDFETINSSTENVLKYRYKHNAKLDTELSWKKYSVGMSARYFSFMENIDLIFESVLFFEGMKEYREAHNNGDLIFDARVGYDLNDKSKLLFTVENIANREWMGRPADLQPMRRFMLQLNINI